MCTPLHSHTQTHMHMQTHMHTHMLTYTHTRTHTHTYIHIYIHIIQACIYIHIYTYNRCKQMHPIFTCQSLNWSMKTKVCLEVCICALASVIYINISKKDWNISGLFSALCVKKMISDSSEDKGTVLRK